MLFSFAIPPQCTCTFHANLNNNNNNTFIYLTCIRHCPFFPCRPAGYTRTRSFASMEAVGAPLTAALISCQKFCTAKISASVPNGIHICGGTIKKHRALYISTILSGREKKNPSYMYPHFFSSTLNSKTCPTFF